MDMSVLFSTMASANSGLADRINEARTYPSKTVENQQSINSMEHRNLNSKINEIKMTHSLHSEKRAETMNHKHL